MSNFFQNYFKWLLLYNFKKVNSLLAVWYAQRPSQTTHCLTKLFPIHIGPLDSGTNCSVDPSSHRIILKIVGFWTITHNKEEGIYKQSGNYLKSRVVGTLGFRGIIAIPPPFLVPTKVKPSFLNELNWTHLFPDLGPGMCSLHSAVWLHIHFETFHCGCYKFFCFN